MIVGAYLPLTFGHSITTDLKSCFHVLSSHWYGEVTACLSLGRDWLLFGRMSFCLWRDGFLFLFICSLTFLADAFRLVVGKDAVTVLVQSSSTSTSIVITLVASDLLTVKQSIPIIMGANIGTSVTSTIVAMGQVANKQEFRRAFAAATVHDMFNFLNVAVLLPLEMATGFFLDYLSSKMVASIYGEVPSGGYEEEDLLKKITEPFTATICQIDSGLIEEIVSETDPDRLAELKAMSFLKPTPTENQYISEYVFDPAKTGLTDIQTGICMLALALILMCIFLGYIVYLLKSLLKGRIAVWIHQVINEEIPDWNIKCGSSMFTIYMGWAAGYLCVVVGLGITVLVQSSSITTSARTPLVGLGVINIERVYPLVVGAYLGTTITGILSALSQSGSKIAPALQTAFDHLFFNVSDWLFGMLCGGYVVYLSMPSNFLETPQRSIAGLRSRTSSNAF